MPKAERPDEINVDALKKSDASSTTDKIIKVDQPSARDVINFQKTNENRHDGSAGNRDAPSLELDFGDGKIASRLTGITEKSLTAAENEKSNVSLKDLLELQETQGNESAKSLVDAYENILKMPRGANRDIALVAWQNDANKKFNQSEANDNKTQRPAAKEIWYHQPIVQAKKIMHEIELAKSEHRESPYSLNSPPKGFPKCNIFLYDVMDAVGVPLPHGKNGARLSVGNLDQALNKDDDFAKVWRRDQEESKWNSERLRFANSFHPQDGDIAIWNNCHLEHTCLLEETIDGTGNTYYAGRDSASGFGYYPLRQWWVESPVPGYGAPDVIYRYKGFIR